MNSGPAPPLVAAAVTEATATAAVPGFQLVPGPRAGETFPHLSHDHVDRMIPILGEIGIL